MGHGRRRSVARNTPVLRRVVVAAALAVVTGAGPARPGEAQIEPSRDGPEAAVLRAVEPEHLMTAEEASRAMVQRSEKLEADYEEVLERVSADAVLHAADPADNSPPDDVLEPPAGADIPLPPDWLGGEISVQESLEDAE